MNVRQKFSISLSLLIVLVVSFVYAASGFTHRISNALTVPSYSETEMNISLSTYRYLFNKPSPENNLIVPRSGIYFGTDVNDKDQIRNFEILIGKNTSLANIYVYWGEKNNGFQELFAAILWLENQVPIITWNPSKSTLHNPVNQPRYRIKRIINGDFDGYLMSWAKSLRKWNKPVIIRFAPEMNGNWLPWGTLYSTPEEYKKAFRHVVDVFRRLKASNILWMWSPNEAGTKNLLDFYPGDKYVDLIGISGFNWGGLKPFERWRSLGEIYQESLNQLQEVKKPIALAEIGCVERPADPMGKAKWIEESFASLKRSYPQVKILIWNNGKSFDIFNWRVDTSKNSLTAFRKAVSNEYFLGRVNIKK